MWELGLEQERETKPNIRVGKLNTQNLFQNQEEREEMIKPKERINFLSLSFFSGEEKTDNRFYEFSRQRICISQDKGIEFMSQTQIF